MGVGFCPQLGGVGPCPAQCIWQGSGFAADQTNAMLAVVRADDESLVPPQAAGLALSVARPLPTETASLGFGGSPVGGGDKNSRFAFFRHFYVGGGIITLRPLWLCRNNPARGLFQQKKRLSQSGCSVPTDTLFPPAHSAFLAHLCEGYHYPRRTPHVVETPGARLSKRLIYRFLTVKQELLFARRLFSCE